jgi:26S proteasome regulatory subunit N8
MHVPSEIVAEEAEEIGVEHLLRDIKDNAVGTLSTRITSQLGSLGGLQGRLEEIRDYLQKVVSGKLPVNHQIIYNLQDIFNLLPNLENNEMVNSFSTKTNDQLLLIYLSSMIRAVIALHNLIDNKIDNLKSENALESAESPAASAEKDVKDLDVEGKDAEKTATEKNDDMQID